MTFHLIPGAIPVCTYTGHTCNADIIADEVPEKLLEGHTIPDVNVTVKNLCLLGETTLYRVKWDAIGIKQETSSEVTIPGSILGIGGTHIFWFGFNGYVMPASDVTLEVTVERCNTSGNWEVCKEETYTIEEGIPAEYGIIVPVINIPTSGVKVQGIGTMDPDAKCDEIQWINPIEYILTPPNTEVVFDEDDIYIPPLNPNVYWCSRVVTNDEYEDELDYAKKSIKVETDRVLTLDPPINAYNGARFRVSLSAQPNPQKIGEPYTVTVSVFEPPYSTEPVGAGLSVELYEDENKQTKITDEDGKAIFAGLHQELLGAYTYTAILSDYTSWLEPAAGIVVDIVEQLGDWWSKFIDWIMETFQLTDRGQAELIAYAMIGVGGLLIGSMVMK